MKIKLIEKLIKYHSPTTDKKANINNLLSNLKRNTGIQKKFLLAAKVTQ